MTFQMGWRDGREGRAWDHRYDTWPAMRQAEYEIGRLQAITLKVNGMKLPRVLDLYDLPGKMLLAVKDEREQRHRPPANLPPMRWTHAPRPERARRVVNQIARMR